MLRDVTMEKKSTSNKWIHKWNDDLLHIVRRNQSKKKGKSLFLLFFRYLHLSRLRSSSGVIRHWNVHCFHMSGLSQFVPVDLHHLEVDLMDMENLEMKFYY